MKTLELLEDVKRKAPTLMVHELIQEFEEFIATVSKTRAQKGVSEADRQEYIDKMGRSYDRLKSYFLRVAASYGMTFDQFCEFINNSNNFAPADWEEIQNTKKQLEAKLNLSAAEKKAKKPNKNLKI
jgi:hypothetical protein